MSITRKIYVQKGVSHTISIQASNDGETYLFLVYQVADVIGMDVQSLIKDFNDTEKSITLSNSQDGSVEIILITEIGLYKLLNMVRTTSQPAMLFQRWVVKTLAEMRVSDEENAAAEEDDNYTIYAGPSMIEDYDDVNMGTVTFPQEEAKTQVKPAPTPATSNHHQKEYKYGKLQHDQKLKEFAKKEVFYTCKLNQLGKQYLVKIGRTRDLTEQVLQLGKDYGVEVLVLDVFVCSNLTQFERRLREQTMLQLFYEKTTTSDGSKSVATYMLTSNQYKEMIKMFQSIIRAIDDAVAVVPPLPPVPVVVDSFAYETEKLKVENNKLLLDQRKYELKTKMIELKMMEMQRQQQQQQPAVVVAEPMMMYHKKESSVYSAIDEDREYDDDVSALGQGSVFSACEKYGAVVKQHVIPTKTARNGGIGGGAKRRILNSDLKKK